MKIKGFEPHVRWTSNPRLWALDRWSLHVRHRRVMGAFTVGPFTFSILWPQRAWLKAYNQGRSRWV